MCSNQNLILETRQAEIVSPISTEKIGINRLKKFHFYADPNKIPLLGDALVIAGTVCYAFSNVGEVGDVFYIYILLLSTILSRNSNKHIISLTM